jgi:hypothetical protein
MSDTLAASTVIKPAHIGPWTYATVAKDFGTASSAAVTVGTITTIKCEKGQLVHVTPLEAMATGVALGGAYVSAKDTISVQIINPTGGDVNTGEKSYKVFFL